MSRADSIRRSVCFGGPLWARCRSPAYAAVFIEPHPTRLSRPCAAFSRHAPRQPRKRCHRQLLPLMMVSHGRHIALAVIPARPALDYFSYHYTAAHARRHPHRCPIQRSGECHPDGGAGSCGGHRRPVPGPGGSRGGLLDDRFVSRRRSNRHGLPLQPQPVQRRYVAGKVREYTRCLTGASAPSCRSPHHMRLTNALCRYRELADDVGRELLCHLTDPSVRGSRLE